MPLVDARGFNLNPPIGEGLGRGVQTLQRFNQLGQQNLAAQREADVRSALSGIRTPQMQEATQQDIDLAEQTAGLGGALAAEEQIAAQPQPVISRNEMIEMAKSIDPGEANKQLKLMGFDDASKRADASRESAQIQSLPFGMRAQAIQERAQKISARGGNPKDTLELLDMNEQEQNNALTGIQLLDLSTKERLGFKAKTAATGPKIGTFNPRDYTVDSFSKFRRTGDESVLVRHTEKTVDIGGVPHRLIPGTTNQYEPIRTTKQVASSKAEIESAVSKARVEAKDRGETLTTLSQAQAALPGLTDTINQLKELAPIATSTLGGKLFNAAVKETGFGATEGSTARAKFIAIINNQVLPLLKPTFGGSFSVQEGESLKATMGDPDASPAEKLAQLDAFIAQKMRDIEAAETKLGEPQAESPKDTQGVIKFTREGQRVQ